MRRRWVLAIQRVENSEIMETVCRINCMLPFIVYYNCVLPHGALFVASDYKERLTGMIFDQKNCFLLLNARRPYK